MAVEKAEGWGPGLGAGSQSRTGVMPMVDWVAGEGGTCVRGGGLCETRSSEECPTMNTKGKKKRKGQRGLGDV